MVIIIDNYFGKKIKFTTGQVVVFKFGINTFITCSEGRKFKSLQFFYQSLNALSLSFWSYFDVKAIIILNFDCYFCLSPDNRLFNWTIGGAQYPI